MKRIRVIVEVEYHPEYEPVSEDDCQRAAEEAIHKVIRDGGRGQVVDVEAEEVNHG